MNYKITGDDFHIFQIKDEENFTKYREKYHNGLDNLCEYVKVVCPDDIVDEYKKLAELVIKLQIQLSLEYCPNSRIHELFNGKEEIQGTTYQAIIDEIDFLTKKIKENKDKVAEINHSIDSFIKFIHISEFYIYRSFEIIPLTSVYDSELSFLLDVKKRFAVLGETTYHFFEKILDMVYTNEVRILDKYKETIEGFLYPDSGNIHKKAQEKNGNQCEESVVFQFDDKIMGEIHKLYNKCVEFENDNVCSKSKFGVMFEEADFSTTLKENGNVPAFVCYVIYYFQTYICDKSVSKEWFSRACLSIGKSEESTRSSAHKSKYWKKR